jgi:uncharacterized DUF497 family protein
MKVAQLKWDELKNRRLREMRGISFEDVEAAIADGRTLADIPPP